MKYKSFNYFKIDIRILYFILLIFMTISEKFDQKDIHAVIPVDRFFGLSVMSRKGYYAADLIARSFFTFT